MGLSNSSTAEGMGSDGLRAVVGCVMGAQGYRPRQPASTRLAMRFSAVPALTVGGWPATFCDLLQRIRTLNVPQNKQQQSLRLYTDEERVRRDASKWTLVQGILAPIQFLVFLISLVLVLRYLYSGEGLEAATYSIVAKTLLLYTIMITGSIWEKDVFGCYLFARPFFWEDVVSMLVLALHTAYLYVFITGAITPREQMLLALAAYATYVVNAAQFLLKLRAARLQRAREIETSGRSLALSE